MLSAYFGPKPLNFKDSEAPGDYRLATVVTENSLNPGQLVNIKQYVTGYGKITGIKIVTYISNELFDEDSSYMTSGFGASKQNPSISTWGKTRINFFNSGITLIPGGILRPDWESHAYIFDVEANSNYIITERSLPDAPITYKLKLKRNTPAGLHYMSFYLTYFNGQKWICRENKIEIKVNNKFEQYSTALSILAATALVVTISHDGLVPFFESIHDLSKYILSTRKG